MYQFVEITNNKNPTDAKSANRKYAAIPEYRECELPEYNTNPMIKALPPILNIGNFLKAVEAKPFFDAKERTYDAATRFHCIERLSRYFEPVNQSVQLYQVITRLLMTGYLARNPDQPNYAQRSNQIYRAIQQEDGKQLEKYVNVPTSASGLTLIGPSGMGKTTNLKYILSLFPQVILHPEYMTYQITWLKVDCPHAGSLKGLCIDIFLAIDQLLGTNYFEKFGKKRNTEDVMLAQVAQITHTHNVGLLVIDEIQNLAASRRSNSDLLNFLVKMDNVIGIPVIRVGTYQAFPILQGNFRNARRGTGEGSIIWERMVNDEHWELFVEEMWQYQWTKTPVELTDEINDALYYETQGIVDITIKLYKMIQGRAIAYGDSEEITVGLIHEVAQEGLFLIKPMLDAIRTNDRDRMEIFQDITPIETTDYMNSLMREAIDKEIKENREKARKNQERQKTSPELNQIILQLIEWDIEPEIAKASAEEIFFNREPDKAINIKIKEAYKLALGGGISKNNKAKAKTQTTRQKGKSNLKNVESDLRTIEKSAKENQISTYEALKSAKIIDPDWMKIIL